jgi:iron complex transport system ATP-binding protein
VDRGRIFALLGPNGCGKTTLLQVLTGMLLPQEGLIHHQGRFAFVPQHFQPGFSRSVLDVVAMGRGGQSRLFPSRAALDQAPARAALERLQLGHLAARNFSELSGGQQQLVTLARALASEAEILMLDEPTSFLDLKNQGIVLDWITRLSREDQLTVVFTTHNPHHALAVADTTLLMQGPRKFLCGPTATVLTETRLGTLCGVQLKHLQFIHKGRRLGTLVPVYSAPSEAS